MSLLQEGLSRLGFPEGRIGTLAPLMERYADEILLFNGAYNLVNASARDEIFVRHILDSLAAAREIERVARGLSVGADGARSARVAIADIGSGGGLPGIPLAAALPQFDFVLVERMSKRCAFLENVRALLGLGNVRVENAELERIPAESFDMATFRAFRPLDGKMLASLLAVLKEGGALAAYKARRKSIDEEMRAANCGRYDVVALDVPFLTDLDAQGRERNLVLIEKRAGVRQATSA